MTNYGPETLHVSKALREHGIVHFEGLPDDEYDCCAQVAIEAYKEYQSRTQRRGSRNTIVSPLLNDV